MSDINKECYDCFGRNTIKRDGELKCLDCGSKFVGDNSEE